VTNHKAPERKGKVQLINAVDLFQKMRKSLGSKRKELGVADIEQIVREYGNFEPTAISKLFDNKTFGYTTITVERPLRLNWSVNAERLQRNRELPVVLKMEQEESDALMATLGSLNPGTVWCNRDKWNTDLKNALRTHGVTLSAAQFKAVSASLSERDPNADVCLDSKGNAEPDPELRDTENVPLTESIEEYFAHEVLPHVPDAWIDPEKSIVGYEIPFTRHFYKYVPPRTLVEIDSDLRTVTDEIQRLLQEIVA
jgi:type I restriction enzyme M protein